MSISYTTNFRFPIADDACENWGAIFNGVLEDIDIEIKAAQTSIISTREEVIISKRLREIVLKHYNNNV